MNLKFEVLPNFLPLWERPKGVRYVILMGGRGAGRSTAASQYAASVLPAKDYVRGAIMREVHTDIRESIWREVKDRLVEQNALPAFYIAEDAMRITYGQNSFKAHGFRASSSSNSAKLKSLAGYNTVIIEEAEEIGEKEFMTLDDSLRTVKGDIVIILCLNPPPKSHWIIQRWFDLLPSGVDGFYIPTLKKGMNDAMHLFGTWEDNVANLDPHTVKRYQEYEHTKPDYYHQMIAGLVPEVVRGKIYNGWQQIDAVPKEARLVRFGEDFGWYPDPAAVVAIWYWNGAYVLDEVEYGTHLSNEHLAGKIMEYGEALTVADSAEPKSIDEQKRLGLNITGAEKGQDSVNYGIKVVSEKKIYVTKRSKNIWTSYENYAWREDKDGNPLNEPAHEWSHTMDAVRYPITSLHQPEKTGVTIHKPAYSSYNRRA